jgi:hypothetical protein
MNDPFHDDEATAAAAIREASLAALATEAAELAAGAAALAIKVTAMAEANVGTPEEADFAELAAEAREFADRRRRCCGFYREDAVAPNGYRWRVAMQARACGRTESRSWRLDQYQLLLSCTSAPTPGHLETLVLLSRRVSS